MDSPEYKACYEKALALLAAAEHSRKLLEMKLIRKDFPAEVVSKVLDRLEEEKSLDDLRYAEMWALFRIRKRGEGALLLIEGLVKRGIARETAREAVKLCREDTSYLEALSRAYEKILLRGPLPRVTIANLLRRKGFSKNEIVRFLEDFR